MTTAFEFSSVSFSYNRDAFILQNISWKVEANSFIAIVGPNGGVKTTLLKLLMGSLTPTTGEITVFGKSPYSIRGRIAYVPQSLIYDRDFPISVLDVVLMGRLSHLKWHGHYTAEDQRLALEALKRVNLLDCQGMSFGRLSGGQRQRTLIARAIVSAPDLLLLDEPTASVDSQAEAEIYAILRSFKGELTLIMVTHDLQAAMETVDSVACVHHTLRMLAQYELCQHYAIGLYHPTLITPVSNRVIP